LLLPHIDGSGEGQRMGISGTE